MAHSIYMSAEDWNPIVTSAMIAFMRTMKTHRVFMSAAARCHHDKWSPAEALFHFGPSGSKWGAGFNFELWASLEGSVHSETGWILPEKQIHHWLWEQAKKIDHQSVHEVIPEFQSMNPTLENLSAFLFQGLVSSLSLLYSPFGSGDLKLRRLRLIEGVSSWVDLIIANDDLHHAHKDSQEKEKNHFETFYTRSYRLQGVHRHHNPDLTDQQNAQLYHKCSAMHGHEYNIEITLRGPVDKKTGLLLSRGEMDKVVDDLILQPFNLRFLNDELGNTSGEILTEAWSLILKKKWENQLVSVIVRETRKNSFVRIFQDCSLINYLLLL